MSRLLFSSFAAAALVASSVSAQPARGAPRPVAKKTIVKKVFVKKAAAVEPAAPAAPAPQYVGGVLVPKGVTMRSMTPAEAQANAIWNLRAGLNVAALQCQFSPFLATVRSYNDLLKHHSGELAAAQTTLQAHFRRYDGKTGLSTFDQYTTRTYNSYSTLDAQYAFCDASALVGRGALMVAKGDFGRFALARIGELRASLTPAAVSPTLLLIDAEPLTIPPLD